MSNKDYTKFSKIDESKIKAEIAEFEDEEIIDATNLKEGLIVDCLKLNVRVAPYSDAEVATIIDASANFLVDESQSTEDFYKVYTEAGAEGYCMRKYVRVGR